MHQAITSLQLQEAEKGNKAKTNLGFSQVSAAVEKPVQVANAD